MSVFLWWVVAAAVAAIALWCSGDLSKSPSELECFAVFTKSEPSFYGLCGLKRTVLEVPCERSGYIHHLEGYEFECIIYKEVP